MHPHLTVSTTVHNNIGRSHYTSIWHIFGGPLLVEHVLVNVSSTLKLLSAPEVDNLA